MGGAGGERDGDRVKILGIIPARYGATRFPGKPLAPVAGKPLLQWVIEGARQSRRLSDLWVATDDERIAKLAERCGVRAVMTASELPSGSDRVRAASKDSGADVLVNIQGDEPMITGELIDRLAECFSDSRVQAATLAHPLSSEQELLSQNAVKVLVNAENEAIYFSRFPIPYSRHTAKDMGGLQGALKHIGMYAWGAKFLEKFCEAPPALIEKAEGLEQLRALYLGARMKVVTIPNALQGVDSPEDVALVEALLAKK